MRNLLQIENITTEDLRNIIKEIISEELLQVKELLNKNNNLSTHDISEQLMSMKEAALFFRITTVSLLKYIKEGDIKEYYVGKRRKFKKSDLEKYLLNNKRRSRY